MKLELCSATRELVFVTGRKTREVAAGATCELTHEAAIGATPELVAGSEAHEAGVM